LVNDLFCAVAVKEPSRIVTRQTGDRRAIWRMSEYRRAYQISRRSDDFLDGFAAENFFAFTLTGIGDPSNIWAAR